MNQELIDQIESYRGVYTKFVCFTLNNIRNEYDDEFELDKDCFCGGGKRKRFVEFFFDWFDSYQK